MSENRSSRRLARTQGRRSISTEFQLVNRAALSNAQAVCERLLPGGRRSGREYVALNPKRADHTLGSFRINLQTGKWADFATDDRGGDLISLVAYLFDLRQSEAARRLASMLNIARVRHE